jgi:hypothetical protein
MISGLERKISYQWKKEGNISMLKNDWFWAIWRRYTVSLRTHSRLQNQILKICWTETYLYIVFNLAGASGTHSVCVCTIHKKCQVDVIRNADIWTKYQHHHCLAKECAILHAIWVNATSILGSRCVCKLKSAQWASWCIILHGISAIIPYTLLHKSTYLGIPSRPQIETFTTNRWMSSIIHKIFNQHFEISKVKV